MKKDTLLFLLVILAGILFVVFWVGHRFRPGVVSPKTITRLVSAPEFNPVKPQYRKSHQGRRVHLAVRVKGQSARDRDITLGFDQEADLVVVVEHQGLYYTDGRDLILSGRRISPARIRPLAELEGWTGIRWIKIEAARRYYVNSNDTEGWWGKIDYRESLDHTGPEGIRAVDVAPLWRSGVKWRGRNVGVMRYKVAVEFGDHFLVSPGREAVLRAGRLPGVRLVSRLGGSGNRVVDLGLSLANTPYIWGSASTRGSGYPKSHQAENRIGADCADLVVAAWRLAGTTSMDYSSVINMYNRFHRSRRAVGPSGKDGNYYLDHKGRRISLGKDRAVKPGAAVLWLFDKKRRGHAALLAEDRGEPGFLDTADLILHTNWDCPQPAALGSIMLGNTPALLVNP